MGIMREAMSKADFDRQEAGLPPLKRKRVERVDPLPPVVPDQVKFSNIPSTPEDEFWDISARPKRVRNEQGVSFVFYDFYLKMKSGEVFSGSLSEADLHKLKRMIPTERVDLLQKIVF